MIFGYDNLHYIASSNFLRIIFSDLWLCYIITQKVLVVKFEPNTLIVNSTPSANSILMYVAGIAEEAKNASRYHIFCVNL